MMIDKPIDKNNDDISSLPSANFATSKHYWLVVWLIPLFALAIAGYIGYDAWKNQGYDIELLFDNASGLEVGKTKVKYKDVDVGKVKQIHLTDDMNLASVTVSLERSFAQQLSQDTSFWVVRPRITTRTISGLSTLFSGAYIAMQPGKNTETKLISPIRGLDEPPTFSGFADGKHFHLVAERLSSMDIGSPVFYRGLAVGEVVSYTLDVNDKMDVQVFVKSPYHRLIRSDTRFWQVNGLEFSVGADGVKAQLDSLLSFMQGGVAFENFAGLVDAETLGKIHQTGTFLLYPNQASIIEKTLTEPSELNRILQSLSGILGQFEKAPITETITELQRTTQGLNRLLDSGQEHSVLRQTEALLGQVNVLMKQMESMPTEMNATLLQTRTTLNTLDTSLQQANRALGDDSVLQQDLRNVLQELSRASTAIETLADTLQRQPNAVIFGKE